MYGWKGKILSIDVSNRRSETVPVAPADYRKFIGGRGLAGHFLIDHVTEEWDSPSMPLIFMTGPLVDTESPTSGRICVMSRSPLTGTVGDTSVGGALGIHIKRAGFDGIIITGKSESLCGITVSEKGIEFHDAEELRGKHISRCRQTLPDRGSSALVGPAAENGVLFASIAVDGHFFSGRSGLGLVMAEKNIKYIHVHGTEKTEIYDREELRGAREEICRLIAASPALLGELGISEFGTGALYDLIRTRRMMPTDNFRKTVYESADHMNAWHYRARYGTRKSGCARCHIQCKKISDHSRIMPEYETMSHFSALIENSDMDTVVEANRLCNELGMDTISAAATLACYSEITGKPLDTRQVVKLLQDTAHRRGEGELLAMGAARYASARDRPEAAMSVKGLELPAYDPRGAWGMALAYATSTRGGCHLRSYPISHEILRKPVATDRFSFSGKARIIKLGEDINAVVDSLTACKFVFFAASLEEYSRAFYGVTGAETSSQELMVAGERIYYHERTMNALNGFTAGDDMLPDRFFTDTGSSGNGITISPLDKNAFFETLRNYYRVRGLDSSGMPVYEKSEELGLPWKS